MLQKAILLNRTDRAWIALGGVNGRKGETGTIQLLRRLEGDINNGVACYGWANYSLGDLLAALHSMRSCKVDLTMWLRTRIGLILLEQREPQKALLSLGHLNLTSDDLMSRFYLALTHTN
jgi:hypothetical protein